MSAPAPPPGDEPPAIPSSATGTAARGFGYAITNLTKVGGLAVAVNEAMIRSELRPIALAVAAFMMAGAQGIETFLDKLFGR